MKMSIQHALDFKDYLLPLRALEKSFRIAGLNIEFDAFVNDGMRLIGIIYDGESKNCMAIEGDSPAQAVKDVAAAVKV
jgi:hypothetical protein